MQLNWRKSVIFAEHMIAQQENRRAPEQIRKGEVRLY